MMITKVKNTLRGSQLRVFVHLMGIFPLVWMLWDGLNANLTINPIQALTQRTGQYAIFFLILTLACTPLNSVFGFREVLKVRRTLGLYAFLYTGLHFILFAGVDYQFNLRLLSDVVLEKPYAIVGLAAFAILFLLALTSYQFWMRRLGKLWKRLHRLVYLVGILVVIHYFWVAKGDLLRLSGDIANPLIYAVILAFLLWLRIPAVRKRVVHTRQQIVSRWKRRRRIQQPAAND